MLRIAEDNLKDEMLENTIHAVVKTELPEMPFEDGSFDAVMFNSVSIFCVLVTIFWLLVSIHCLLVYRIKVSQPK